jgi:hypothetical protein
MKTGMCSACCCAQSAGDVMRAEIGGVPSELSRGGVETPSKSIDSPQITSPIQ